MAEKLTHAITVKFTEQGAKRTELLAKAKGMEVSEYVRHLVDSDAAEQRQVFELLAEVFSGDHQFDNGNQDSRGLPVSRFHG